METPENASEGAEYSIGVANSELTSLNSETIPNVNARRSIVEVVETAKEVSNYVVREDNTLGLRGDSNEDGKVDLQDAIKIAKYLIGKDKLSVNGSCQADINENNKVELQDVIGVSKYMMASDKTNAWETILKNNLNIYIDTHENVFAFGSRFCWEKSKLNPVVCIFKNYS